MYRVRVGSRWLLRWYYGHDPEFTASAAEAGSHDFNAACKAVTDLGRGEVVDDNGKVVPLPAPPPPVLAE